MQKVLVSVPSCISEYPGEPLPTSMGSERQMDQEKGALIRHPPRSDKQMKMLQFHLPCLLTLIHTRPLHTVPGNKPQWDFWRRQAWGSVNSEMRVKVLTRENCQQNPLLPPTERRIC